MDRLHRQCAKGPSAPNTTEPMKLARNVPFVVDAAEIRPAVGSAPTRIIFYLENIHLSKAAALFNTALIVNLYKVSAIHDPPA